MVQTRRKNVRSRSWPCKREHFQCMSALPRWADIAEDEHHVRKVPIADIGQGRSKNDGISFSPYEGPPRTSASSGVNHLSLRNRGTRCLGRQTFCGRFPAFRP